MQLLSIAGLLRFHHSCRQWMRSIVSTTNGGRHNLVLKAHYEHLLTVGKRKKVAFVADMRQLLTVIDAITKHGSKWGPTLHLA